MGQTPPRWTEEELQQWLSRRGSATPTSAPPSVPKKRKSKIELPPAAEMPSVEVEPKKRLARAHTTKKEVAPAAAQLAEAIKDLAASKPKKKRRGVEVEPFVRSVLNCPIRARVELGESPSLSLLFEGAKLLSLNELFSIMQFRKYEAIRYKKAWRMAVKRSLRQLGPHPWQEIFPGPVKLTLFRRSAKSNDIDSARVLFKYAIDSLVRAGVLIDDNRQVIPVMDEAFSEGSPAVGMRIERCLDPPALNLIEPETLWFGQA